MSLTCPKCAGPNKPDADECRWCGASLRKALIKEQEDWQQSDWNPFRGFSFRLSGCGVLAVMVLALGFVALVSGSMPEGKEKRSVEGLGGSLIIIFVAVGILCWAAVGIARVFNGGK